MVESAPLLRECTLAGTGGSNPLFSANIYFRRVFEKVKKEFNDLTEAMSKTESSSSSNLEDEDYLWLSENDLNKE